MTETQAIIVASILHEAGRLAQSSENDLTRNADLRFPMKRILNGHITVAIDEYRSVFQQVVASGLLQGQ